MSQENCKHENAKDGAKFCPDCGKAISEESDSRVKKLIREALEEYDAEKEKKKTLKAPEVPEEEEPKNELERILRKKKEVKK